MAKTLSLIFIVINLLVFNMMEQSFCAMHLMQATRRIIQEYTGVWVFKNIRSFLRMVSLAWLYLIGRCVFQLNQFEAQINRSERTERRPVHPYIQSNSNYLTALHSSSSFQKSWYAIPYVQILSNYMNTLAFDIFKDERFAVTILYMCKVH